MPNASDDTQAVALGDEDEAELLDDEFDESHSWMWIYYDRREDVFRAVRAADRLGISWSMSSRWESGPHQTETQQWVVELKRNDFLPDAANSSVTERAE